MSAPSAWVSGRLGVRVETTRSEVGCRVEDLVGLALRRNPKRAHLLVSTVLGKHVPTDPRIVAGAGLLLGLLVHDSLNDENLSSRAQLADMLTEAVRAGGGEPAATFGRHVRAAALAATTMAPSVTVLGYAETATGLGHCVADALPGSDYVHSTRRVTEVPSIGGFEEEHSHATSHLLCPRDPGLLTGPRAAARPLVLVDDELSTGRTVLNTIAALHRLAPRERYVVAALVDLRSDQDEAAMHARAAELGTRIDVVSVARGRVELPTSLLPDAAAALAELPECTTPQSPWPARRHAGQPPEAQHAFREGGRHGISHDERRALVPALLHVAGAAAPKPGERLLVLGTEELMAAPLLLAQAFADAEPTATVRFSSTTRSPAVAVDDAGYPLRTAIQFFSNESADAATAESSSVRYAYNVRPGVGEPRWDRIVAVFDQAAHDGGTLPHREPQLFTLLGTPGTVYEEVVLRAEVTDELSADSALRGPQFGSYRPEEVGWLLKDLSDVHLEAPTQDRERDIQSGRAHYAESLPIEFQPDAAYTALFHEAVAESATRLAYATGLVAEIIWAERGENPMLVSLARAGVPVGILLRRWYEFTRGRHVPHYAVSIVRGRGIDRVALDALARQPHEAVFVDGWTGKGAIRRELDAAIRDHNSTHGTDFNPEMAVLADPGRCVRTFGTRDDFLIPSACLNSTVSGLVSRTVLNDTLIGPGEMHGAKFYAHLAASDVSGVFLDAVSDQFVDVVDAVTADWPALAASDRTPDWAGWAAVERISQQYGIGEVNLVKPGVGETTRVLLRRVPDRVLIRPGHEADLRHVLVLAEQRGVPVETVADLPYSCVGLIKPQDGGEG